MTFFRIGTVEEVVVHLAAIGPKAVLMGGFRSHVKRGTVGVVEEDPVRVAFCAER
jgi:hypothetical protein